MIRQFTSKTQQTGLLGEEKAVMFLMKHNFTVLARNINNRHGEIDILAKKHGIWHFFEVKAGKQGSWFNPADNLTKDKLWKFYRAIEYFCIQERIKEYKIQAILVLLPQNDNTEPIIEIVDLS